MIDAQHSIAIHESGHMLACRAFGRRIVGVTIDPDKEDQGHLLTWVRDETIREIRESLVIFAAGQVAQQRLVPGFELDGSSAVDDRQMLSLARKLHGLAAAEGIVAGECHRAIEMAGLFVDEHRERIEAVANALVAFNNTTAAVPIGSRSLTPRLEAWLSS